jgi:hypothetical protein
MKPILEEIDLSKTTKHGGAGLSVGPTYLVLYCGRFYTGTFGKQWYGLNFNGIYDAGAQYDPPGENYSSWQKIWKIKNAGAIAKAEEKSFMERRRTYAIGRLKSNGQTITDAAPLEAFAYNPKVPAMPRRGDEDDE